MRIGIFTDSFHYPIKGGVNRVAYELITHLARIDRENSYVLFNTFGASDLEAFGIDSPNFSSVTIPGSRKYRWGLWLLLSAPCVEKWTGPLDVMHTPFHFVPPSVAPAVVTVHDLFVFEDASLFTPQLRIIDRMSLRRAAKADRIACISDTTRGKIIRFLHAPETNIRTIYDGLSDEFHSPPARSDESSRVRGKFGIRGEYFLNLGVIQPRKNQHRLIQAFEIFRKAHPADTTQLVLAGQKGWITGEFDELLDRSPLRNDIHVTGFVDDADVPALMRGSRAFLFPTLLEGFGIPALEALAVGAPLVASDLPVLREVTGDAAIFVDPLSPQSIADGLARVCEDSALRDENVRKGLLRANNRRFTWEYVAEQYLDLYRLAADRKQD